MCQLVFRRTGGVESSETTRRGPERGEGTDRADGKGRTVAKEKRGGIEQEERKRFVCPLPRRLQEEPFLAHSTHEEHERKANARSGECLKKDKHYGAPFFASNSPIFSAVLPVSGTTKPPRAPQLIVLR